MENHVVCIPFPAQGHIRPMLKLAQFLHFRFDFNVTFINTHHNHQTLLNNYPLACSNENNLKSTFFKFEFLTEGDNPKDFLSILNSVVNNELELPLKELLMSKLSSSHNNSNNNGNSKNCSQSRISYMISDVVMSSFTLKVAEELEIPAVLLENASACSLLACFNYRQLLDRGIIPLPDKSCLTNGYLEKEIDCIPSLKGICLKDMPSFIRTTDPNDMMLNIVMLNAHRALNNHSRAIIFNTFDSLEQDALKELSSINPNIYPIGPLNLMVDCRISKNDTINIGSNNNDLLEKTRDDDHNNEYYMQWLDSQESNSVLYISLGSIVVVSQETLIELAWGVAKSGAKFLWIIRSDQVTSNKGNDSVEFDRFEEEIKGRGVVVDWCDQERVLAHRSIGGFLTHCGWNSTIESISNGVPMICWPFAADQPTISWYCCNCLGIGVKMSEDIKRDKVEKLVKEFMETGNNGKEMKTKAMKWRNLAIEATVSSHGTSFVNLSNIVNNVLRVKNK